MKFQYFKKHVNTEDKDQPIYEDQYILYENEEE